MGVGTPPGYLLPGVAIFCFGVFLFSLRSTGHFNQNLSMVERALAIAIGLIIIQPISPLLSRVFCVVGLLLPVYFIAHKARVAKVLSGGINLS